MQNTSLLQAAGIAGGTLAIAALGFAAALFVMPQQQPERGPVELSEQARQDIAADVAQATAEAMSAELLSDKQVQAAVKQGMISFVKDRAGGGGTQKTKGAKAGGGQAPTAQVPAVSDTEHVLGPADATYTLIEYSDYECPYCARLHNRILPELRERMGDDLRVVYRHRPLPMHEPQATKSALAAECVASMKGDGAFWQYTSALFGDQQDAPLVEVGKSMGIDANALSECIDSERHSDRVQAHLDQARQLGVSGTPTMFVRKTGTETARRLNGAQPAARIEQVIRQLGS